MQPPYAWAERLPTLESERLRLRWLTEDDAPALLEVFGDPRVIRWWSSPLMEDLDAARELVADIHDHFAARELFQWGLADAATDRVLGTTTLCDFTSGQRRAEVGIALGADHWGRGLAREALARLVDFAFDELGLTRLEADVDPRNARSLTLFESQGFKREGLLRERWHLQGEVQDAVLLGLLARERRRG